MKRVLFVFLLLNTLSVISQESLRKYKIEFYSAELDNVYFKNNHSTLNELKTITINNKEIFNVNLDDFNYSTGVNNYQRKFIFNIGILALKPNNNNIIMLGLTYQYGNRSNLYYYKKEVIPADTSVLSDTTIYTGYSFQHEITEIGINLSKMFTSNIERKISLFTGLGAEINYSLISKINYLYSTDSKFLSYLNTSYYYQTDLKSSFSSSVNTKKSFSFRPYIPVGINYIASKNQAGLNQLHLFINLKLGLEYQFIFDHINYVRPFICLGSGIKYVLV